MFRQRLDDSVIETFFDDNLARKAYPDNFEKNEIVDGIRKMSGNELNPARKRLCKNLLVEANALGLSIYGHVNYMGAIGLDISVGKLVEANSPGKLCLRIAKNRVHIDSLTINRPVVEAYEIYNKFVNYPQTAMKKNRLVQRLQESLQFADRFVRFQFVHAFVVGEEAVRRSRQNRRTQNDEYETHQNCRNQHRKNPSGT